MTAPFDSTHALETLEFPKLRELIARECVTPFGQSHVERISPLFDKTLIDRRQQEISELLDIFKFGQAFPLTRMNDCREEIAQTQAEGGFLDPESIRNVLELIEIANSLFGYDYERRDRFPAIVDYLKQIRAFPELQKEIVRTIDENNEVRDNASKDLKKIRRNLHDARNKIMSVLGEVLGQQKKQSGWQDDVITQRNDRYVVPIISGQYKSDQGILHDRSQSGATFFVEPRQAVDLNNKINLLKQEERAEIRRILTMLTMEIAMRAEALMQNIEIIGKLDCLYAAAKFSAKVNAVRPKITDSSEFNLVEARHPLLILQLGEPKKVVPLDLTLDRERRVIIITGPNTGGKTIALKTVGLLALMAQSGLPIPANEKSSLGIFDRFFADIGDEQSIELSLSTFSSHVRNIIDAVNNATANSLVLLDEIGAGTDPKEGSSLAEAVVLKLTERGVLMISSTHYSQLKTLALDHSEIDNASLEFNRETLAPTYQVQLGIPGSSYAIEIAGRLGMPEDICSHASELLGTGERSLSELIASLDLELKQVREDKITLTERLARADELERLYKSQKEKFDREIEKARTEALEETSSILDDTRKNVERMVADIRSSKADDKSVKGVHKFLRETSERVEQKRRKAQPKQQRDDSSAVFNVEDTVRIISLNQIGVIEEMIGQDRARVRVGSMATVVPIRNLEKLSARGAKKAKKSVTLTSGTDTSNISPEIHLRGMTVEEAKDALDKFLDDAVIAGLHQVYVIHGKGTGALRKNLTAFLQGHQDVDSVRLGNWNEGGAGVTVVKLKQ